MRIEMALGVVRRLAPAAFGLLLALAPDSASAACEAPGGELLALTSDDIGGTGRGDPEDGIGGTGRGDPEDGIGGTGRGDPEDGIGGTGRERDGLGGTGASATREGPGGTGLFGTLTGFGSLCVNGHEVILDPATPVALHGASASTDVLRVGQVLWLEARERDGALHATRVDVILAAAGPIEAIRAGGALLQVDGRSIALLDDALVVDGRSGLPVEVAALEVGHVVEVSGLVGGDGVVFASRVERRPLRRPRIELPDPAELARRAGLARVSVEGFVRRGPEGDLRVGSFALALAPDAAPAAALAADTRVLVQGLHHGAVVAVETIRLPSPPKPPPVPPAIQPGGVVAPPQGRSEPPSLAPGRAAPKPAPAPSPRPAPAPNRRPKTPGADRIRPVPGDVKAVPVR